MDPSRGGSLYQHKTVTGSKFRYFIKSISKIEHDHEIFRPSTSTYYWMDADHPHVQPYLQLTHILWLDSLEIGDKLWFLYINEWCIGILKEYILRIDQPIINLKVKRLNDPDIYLKEIHIDINQMTESDISQKEREYINGDFYDDMICKSCGKMADGTEYGIIPKCMSCYQYCCNSCLRHFKYCKSCVIKEEIDEMADIIGDGIDQRINQFIKVEAVHQFKGIDIECDEFQNRKQMKVDSDVLLPSQVPQVTNPQSSVPFTVDTNPVFSTSNTSSTPMTGSTSSGGNGSNEAIVVDGHGNIKSKIAHIIAEYAIGYIIDCPNKKNCNNTIYIDNEYEFDKIFSYYNVNNKYIHQWKNGEIVWVYGKYRRFFCGDRQNCQMITCKRICGWSYCRQTDAALSICVNHIPNCDNCNVRNW